MILWQDRKAGFTGGMQTAIKGFFRYSHIVTSAAVSTAPTVTAMVFRTRSDLKMPTIPLSATPEQVVFYRQVIFTLDKLVKDAAYDLDQIQAQLNSAQTGLLTIDDGSNFRVISTVVKGLLTDITVGGSTSGEGTWLT